MRQDLMTTERWPPFDIRSGHRREEFQADALRRFVVGEWRRWWLTQRSN